MLSLIKRIFCKHSPVFVRNIYGDEIIMLGWKRSIWCCSKCGAMILKDQLNKDDTP